MGELKLCAYCGRHKMPDGFPVSFRAECWQCAWDRHIHDEHPKIRRRIRRAAKKRARRLTEADIVAAVTTSEHRQYLGPKADR